MKERIVNLKLFKALFKLKENEIMTAREMADSLANNHVIAAPYYTKNVDRRFVVSPRTIWQSSKTKRKSRIRF